jgi:hypothetical protein
VPATGQRKPTSLSSRIRLYLLDHPGGHSASQLADAISPPEDRADDRTWWSQAVSAECGRMARRGLLTRERASAAAMGPGVTYSLPTTPTPPGETDAGNHSP